MKDIGVQYALFAQPVHYNKTNGHVIGSALHEVLQYGHAYLLAAMLTQLVAYSLGAQSIVKG